MELTSSEIYRKITSDSSQIEVAILLAVERKILKGPVALTMAARISGRTRSNSDQRGVARCRIRPAERVSVGAGGHPLSVAKFGVRSSGRHTGKRVLDALG